MQHMQRGQHAKSSCRRWLPLGVLAQISTPSAAHFLKSHQLLVQKFCGGSKSAKTLIRPPTAAASLSMARDGAVAMLGVGSRARRDSIAAYAAWSAREIELQALATAWSARPDLHTVCRSFPKISSALSAKVCGGSRSAKKGRVPFHGLTFSAFLSCFQTDTKPYSRDQRLSEND